MNMKLNTLTKLMKWFSISLACAATSLVGVPLDVSYNGSLADETGSPLDGEYFFKFVIADMDGTTVVWNNEEGSAATTVDPAPVSVVVTQGVFSTVLAGIESDALATDGLYLHVWVSDAVDGTFEALGAEALNSVPYAIRAGAVNVEDISGDIASIIPEGSINAEMLGTVLVDVPFLDADGDGVPDDPSEEGARRVSIQDFLQSISDNSKLGFEQVSDEREGYVVLLDVDQPIASVRGWSEGSPASAMRPFDSYPSHYKDPFPISQVYEYNGGLMPKIDVLDPETKEVVTGVDSALVPGLNFLWSVEDVERTAPNVNQSGPFWHPRYRADGWDEGRLVVAGTPTEVGDFPVLVRATNAWGQDFVQLYTVQVRDIEIDTTVFLERQAMGSSSWTTSGAATPFGGDPVRARFETEDDILLTDNIVVRWTYPDPDSIDPGDTLTSDIPGEMGKVFYVNSDGSPAGVGASQGVQLLDEDPLDAADRSHVGPYSAQILLDWGQGVNIGGASISDILDGFTFPADAIIYEAPNVNTTVGPGYVPPASPQHVLFNQFTNTASNIIGLKPSSRYTAQRYGASPAGDQGAPLGDLTEDWHLRGVLTGGDTEKGLVGTNPFWVIDTGSYIRGVMENRWIQQKRVRWLVDSSSYYGEHSIKLVETVVTDGVDDPRVDLAVDGFGPDPADANWPLSDGDGVIHDDLEVRSAFSFPEDGGDFTYLAGSSRIRPNTDPGNWNNYLFYPYDKMVIYHQYSTNGFIDSLTPISAIVEVGSNINIVNDLVDATQVAGYPVNIGGDFGTTNGATTDLLKPAEENGSGRIVVWGVNDLAYIWTNPNGYIFDVTSTNGNTVQVGGSNLVNNITDNDSATDVTFNLNLDSGFSNEHTDAGVRVLSDVVIMDFYMQRINLMENPGTAPYWPDDGDLVTTEESVSVTAGDDVQLTVLAYIRPPLWTTLSLDDGDITDGPGRDLSARFFLVPFQTNVAVEITNNITMTVDSTVGMDADWNDNHVQGPIDNRIMYRWDVILENPLQDLATTNVATGYIYAVITSSIDGKVVNSVSTSTVSSNTIAGNLLAINADTPLWDTGIGVSTWQPPSIAEEDVIGPDHRLDARVKMPLDPAAGEGIIEVAPAP